MHKYVKLLALFMTALTFTACGNKLGTSSEKIAVIKWDKAVEAHPEHARLVQGQKVIKSLVLRRDAQADLGKSQMSSVAHLRGLKQLSEQSYLEAELKTRLLEKEQVGKERLYKETKLVEKEAEEVIAPRRQAIEDEYSLRIFNLRLEKDRARANMRPMDADSVKVSLDAIDKKIQALVAERESRMLDIELEKQEYISAKMAPKVTALQEEIRELAEKTRAENKTIVANKDGKYDKLMAAAPEALASALAVMDREIDKQQDKNNNLKKQINSDIESIAIKLAKERGYTIVFNTFKANVSADDITNDIIAGFKNLKNK